MTENEIQILIRAKNTTSAAFAAARKDMASVGATAKSTTQAFGALKGGLGALGIAFSAVQVLGFAKDLVDAAGDIADMSAKLGISTTAVQRFTNAAELGGGSMEGVGAAINKMNLTL